jgi:hypothetical protein
MRGGKATIGDIEIFNRPRELTRTKKHNRGSTQIYEDKDQINREWIRRRFAVARQATN